MHGPPRKIAFVLAASDHGSMILNRFDGRRLDDGRGYGLAFQILESAAFDAKEVELACSLLDLRRRYAGDGVFALDCGANIGVHTVEWARRMTGWGSVLAFEAQERIFYALGGNIALNNCFNARAVHAAVAAADGTLRIPTPDYQQPGSFGSLELKKRDNTEFIGQPVDYSEESLSEVRSLKIDSLDLRRLDLLKIDVEGMEEEVLAGAQRTLAQCRPVVLVEWIKAGKSRLNEMLEAAGYRVFETGINLLAVHHEDAVLGHVQRGEAKQPNSGQSEEGA